MNVSEVNVFSSTSGLNITLEIICHKAKSMLHADWCTCFAPNSQTGKMKALVNWGLSEESYVEFQGFCGNFSLKNFIAAEELEKPVIIDPRDNKQGTAFDGINRLSPGERILICPSLMYGQLFGYMAWGYRLKKSLPSDAIERAEPFADQAALSLKYNQLDKMTRRQNARLAALLDLSTTIYSSLNYTEVLEKVAVYSKDLVGADSCSIYIRKKFSGDLVPLVVKDRRYAEQLKNHVVKAGEYLTGQVVVDGIGKLVNRDSKGVAEVVIPGIEICPSSVISVPLIWSEEILGAITLRKWESGTFGKGDLDILTIFARQAADAIENARLFESLEKAYNELSTTQEQLIMSERLRALGEMAGGIAHDFNNILGIILGKSQILQRITDNEKILNGLKTIEKSAIEGAKTVLRIQEFTRVASPGIESEVDMNQVVRDAVEVTKPKWKDDAQRRGVFIEIKLELTSSQKVSGTPSDLKEAISNLIGNAVDALPNGGSVVISTQDKNEFLQITVADDGVGMDEETAKKIFFPFFTTKSKMGTGLGLAVTYGIISRHKGEISVDSRPGQGSVFSIKLPHLLSREVPNVESGNLTVGDRKARILVIDDDENILNIIYEMLTNCGHSIVTAVGGKEGIEKFQPEAFDMVFTDLGMPEVSGWDVVRNVKNRDSMMPTILISGWGAQLDDEALANSKVDFVVAKPFQLQKLLDIINRAFLVKEGKASHDMALRV